MDLNQAHLKLNSNLTNQLLGIINKSTPDHGQGPSTSNENRNNGATNVKEDLVIKQLDALKELLECPVCLQTPGTSMYLCVQGHSICSSCRARVKKCPLCRQDLLNTRNLLVEQLINALEVKCKYATEGCRAMVSARQKTNHLKKCYFRPIPCNFSGDRHVCKNSLIKFTNYIKHLITVHKMNGVEGTVLSVMQWAQLGALSLTTDILWHEWPIQYIQAYDTTFITGSEISSGKMFWWLYVFGDRNQSDKYCVNISLKNQNKTISMSWSGPVFSIRIAPDSIKNRGLCLMVSKETLRPFTSAVNDSNGSNNDKVGWNVVFKVLKKETKPLQHAGQAAIQN